MSQLFFFFFTLHHFQTSLPRHLRDLETVLDQKTFSQFCRVHVLLAISGKVNPPPSPAKQISSLQVVCTYLVSDTNLPPLRPLIRRRQPGDATDRPRSTRRSGGSTPTNKSCLISPPPPPGHPRKMKKKINPEVFAASA